MSDLPEQTRENVEILQESGRNLLNILNDILDLSKIEAGKVELELAEVEIAKTVGSVLSLAKGQIEKKGLWLKEPASVDLRFPVILSDATRLRQILSNLISNAQKFTLEGGIEIVLSQRCLEGGKVETKFEVVDTGIGLSKYQQVKVFEPFSQADLSTTRVYGGTGLGLSITKQLVELMGGRIGVNSSEGKGSTFWFTIINDPVRAGLSVGEDQLGTPNHMPDDMAQDLPYILVVEDNKTNQLLIRKVLDAFGFEYLLVGDGKEAVDVVSRWSFDLVLMDINMPVMDGVEATRQIRKLPGEKGTIPIVALTANAMKGDRERFLAVGMDDYLSKPISPPQLLEIVLRLTQSADAPKSSEISATRRRA